MASRRKRQRRIVRVPPTINECHEEMDGDEELLDEDQYLLPNSVLNDIDLIEIDDIADDKPSTSTASYLAHPLRTSGLGVNWLVRYSQNWAHCLDKVEVRRGKVTAWRKSVGDRPPQPAFEIKARMRAFGLTKSRGQEEFLQKALLRLSQPIRRLCVHQNSITAQFAQGIVASRSEKGRIELLRLCFVEKKGSRRIQTIEEAFPDNLIDQSQHASIQIFRSSSLRQLHRLLYRSLCLEPYFYVARRHRSHNNLTISAISKRQKNKKETSRILLEVLGCFIAVLPELMKYISYFSLEISNVYSDALLSSLNFALRGHSAVLSKTPSSLRIRAGDEVFVLQVSGTSRTLYTYSLKHEWVQSAAMRPNSVTNEQRRLLHLLHGS